MAYVESLPFDAPDKSMSSASRDGEAADFRLAMRELANGVAVVTTGHGAARAGCTATALCSLSLDPPSLLVCIALTSTTLASLRANQAFAVNLLGGDHAAIAERFSGRSGLSGAARFAEAEWMTLATGAPLLSAALASIDCRVEEVIERHTHAIVIGRVAALRRNGGGAALVHWRGRYEGLG